MTLTDVTLGEHVLEFVDSADVDVLGRRLGQGVVVEVEQLLGVEGNKTLKDAVPDATGTAEERQRQSAQAMAEGRPAGTDIVPMTLPSRS